MTDNVNVVVTTNDSNSEKANYNYELLFQKDNTSIFGDNLPTSILQIEAESTSDVTSETVEQGGFASFYKTKKPKNINFDIAFNTDDDKQLSILDTVYDYIYKFDYEDKILIQAELDGKYGLYDEFGNVIQYDENGDPIVQTGPTTPAE